MKGEKKRYRHYREEEQDNARTSANGMIRQKGGEKGEKKRKLPDIVRFIEKGKERYALDEAIESGGTWGV